MLPLSIYYWKVTFSVIFCISTFAIFTQAKAKINYSYIVSNILDFAERESHHDEYSIISFDYNDKNVRRILYHYESSKVLSREVIYTSVHLLLSTRNSSSSLKGSLSKQRILALASSSNSLHWQNYLNMLAKSNLKSSILLFIGEIENQKIEQLHNMLNNLSKNSLFYMAYQLKESSEELVWHQVLTLQGYSKAVINLVEFDSFGRVIESYDMQGLHIVSISLSWAPYFTLYNCTERKRNCSSDGYLTDLMNILGGMMNFTWESHGEIEGNWGTTAISGPSNSSGVWGGLVGNVFSGKYQISIR